MVLLDSDPRTELAPSAIREPLASSGVIFGSDPSSYQARGMGIRSGVHFTQQEQLDLYVGLRAIELDFDQVVYSRVLRQTGGAVEVFEKRYPHIFQDS